MAGILRGLHGREGGEGLLQWWLHQAVTGAAAGSPTLERLALVTAALLESDTQHRGADIAAGLLWGLLRYDPALAELKDDPAAQHATAQAPPDISHEVWARFLHGGNSTEQKEK